jgi:hypothetical protein
MTTICLSEKMIKRLDNLDHLLNFCDEEGRLIGSFVPEAMKAGLKPVPRAENVPRPVDGELGVEMCVYGFQTDLE